MCYLELVRISPGLVPPRARPAAADQPQPDGAGPLSPRGAQLCLPVFGRYPEQVNL